MAPTTVLICDASRAGAQRLRSLLEHDGSVAVLGISPSGEHALESLPRLRPALVAIDLDLPGMDAVRAIEAIMRAHPVPILALGDAGERAAAALGAGALDALPKPAPDGAAALRRRVRQLARAGVPAGAARPPAGRRGRPALAVGIGASTGGPGALRVVLSGLPADFPLPVLVVQHIGAGFVDGLASWLDGQVAPPVRVAADGSFATPGVWLAPDDVHLTLTRSLRIVLDPSDAEGLHRPSVDVLFESMAAALGARAVAVMLTGMGSDGARGVGAIAAAGGLALAQDRDSSVVYGMPGAAVAQGARALPLQEIAGALRALEPARRRT